MFIFFYIASAFFFIMGIANLIFDNAAWTLPALGLSFYCAFRGTTLHVKDDAQNESRELDRLYN